MRGHIFAADKMLDLTHRQLHYVQSLAGFFLILRESIFEIDFY
jgi:hypothetical protein